MTTRSRKSSLKPQASPLKKAYSSPSPGSEKPPFPKELQERVAEIKRREITPDRWIRFVVRREKISCAVGRLVQVNKNSS